MNYINKLMHHFILSCPLKIMLEIRLSKTISKLFQYSFSQKVLTNTLYRKYTKNNIESILNNNDVQMDIQLGFNYYECFDIDPIDGIKMHCTNMDFFRSNGEAKLNFGDGTRRLIVKDIGMSTHFSMRSKSPFSNCEITISFGQNKIGSYCTYLSLKERVNNNIIFMGSKFKRFAGRDVEQIGSVALIYNAIPPGKFSYVILPFYVPCIFSMGPICNIFTYNTDVLISFCDIGRAKTEGSDIVRVNNMNIYVYNLNNRNLVAKIDVKYKFSEQCMHIVPVSLSCVGRHLVYAQYLKNVDSIKLIWINLDSWKADEISNYRVTDPNLVGIKLIGIHDSLSALVLIKRFPQKGTIKSNISAKAYYF